MTAVAQRDPRQALVARVRSDEFRQEIRLALPDNVSVDRFSRATVTALLQSPELAEADQSSLFLALVKCAQMGLVPDGRQAAVTVFNTKTKINGRDVWVKKAQCLPMVGGLRDIAAEYGWTLRARAVFANDEFDYAEEPPALTHRPARPGVDRGDLVAAYAIAVHRDGRRLQRVLPPEEIAKRRKVAKTQNVWEQWEPQMWEKTAAKDLFAELPLDPADQRIRRVIDSSDLEPGDAARLMYGPSAAAAPERDAGSSPARAPQPVTSTVTAGDDAVAEAAASDTDGPASDDPLGEEPGPDLTDEERAARDAAEVAALAAAGFNPGSAKWPGMTLGEIFNHGDDGRDYIRWCLAGGAKKSEFVEALAAFASFYAPELLPASEGGAE